MHSHPSDPNMGWRSEFNFVHLLETTVMDLEVRLTRFEPLLHRDGVVPPAQNIEDVTSERFLETRRVMHCVVAVNGHQMSIKEGVVERVQAQDIVDVCALFIRFGLAPWDYVADTEQLPLGYPGHTTSSTCVIKDSPSQRILVDTDFDNGFTVVSRFNSIDKGQVIPIEINCPADYAMFPEVFVGFCEHSVGVLLELVPNICGRSPWMCESLATSFDQSQIHAREVVPSHGDGVFGASCDVHHDLDVVFPASLRIEIERTGCNELVSLPSRPWPHVIQSR